MFVSRVLQVGILLLSAVAPTLASVTPEEFAEYKRAAQLSLTAFPKCKMPLGNAKTADIKGSASGYISVDKVRKQVLVVMRGSMSPRDFKYDLEVKMVPYTLPGSAGCQGCMISQGLYKALSRSIDSIITNTQNAMAVNPGYTVYVTGHSLGGTTAQLVGLALVEKFGAAKVKLVALGAFRIGNQAFATFEESKFLPGNFVRLTHSNDGVPRIPSKKLGYVHGGPEMWMEGKKIVDGNTFKACNGPEDPTCVQKFGESKSPVNGAHVHYIVSFLSPKCLSKAGTSPAGQALGVIPQIVPDAGTPPGPVAPPPGAKTKAKHDMKNMFKKKGGSMAA